MTITITIGEKCWHDEIDGWSVDRTHHPGAPVFNNDEATEPLANWRYINIPVWHSMAEECGITAWLSDRQTGLLAESQTDVVRPLSEDDFGIVNNAYLLRSAFREGKPGWDAEFDEEELGQVPLNTRHDEYLARLMWLRFWIRWALDNCEEPSVVVSW